MELMHGVLVKEVSMMKNQELGVVGIFDVINAVGITKEFGTRKNILA